jgi:outer membrane protein assembly factor BamD
MFSLRSFTTDHCLPVAAFLILLSGAGCSSSESTKTMSATERFHAGFVKFQDRDYLEAIDEFKVVSLQHQGTNVADSAQFYLAESRFRREEFILAAFEYDVLVRTMPSSVFIPRARFQRATSFYSLSPRSFLDQDYTRKAIDEYQAFLEFHPSDSLAATADRRIRELTAKLAEKEYNNGVTYMKLEYYKAAAFYFDLVLEKYSDSPSAERALLAKADALRGRKHYAEAKDVIEKFFSKYPNSTLREDAEGIRSDITAGLTSKDAVPPPPVGRGR